MTSGQGRGGAPMKAAEELGSSLEELLISQKYRLQRDA